MPPCASTHLVGYLFEIGPTVAAGMGDGPITHADIAAWMGNTGIRLSPWQARTLRRASMDYLAEAGKATERGCPAPWQSKDAAIDRVVAVNVSKNAIRNLAKL